MFRRASAPAVSTSLGVAAGLGALVGLGALAVLLGWSPLLLVLASTGALATATAARLGWAMGITLAPLALLATYVTLVQIYPDVDVPYGAANAVVLVLAGLVGVALVARWGLARPGRAGWVTAAAAAVVPVGAAAALLLSRAVGGQHKLSWAMGNDSVWNVFFSRILINDGGADPEKSPSPAIGLHELIALFLMPGRGGLRPAELLEHDLKRALTAMVLLLVVAGVLGGIGVARALPARQLATRAVVAVVASAVPFTWFVMGFAFRLGFWNSVFATVVLLAAWIAMSESRRHPTAATATLALAALCLLPIWTPTALVPLLMGAVVFVRELRAHLRLRRTDLVLWLVPPLALAWYGLTVIRPLLTTQGDALGYDGAMFHISLTNVVVVLVLMVGVAAAVAASGRGHDHLVVALTLGTATLGGLWYLMGQRAEAVSGTWGYYPAKFGWTASILAVFVTLHAVAALAVRRTPARADAPTPEGRPTLRARARRAGGVVAAGLATTAVGAVLIGQVPPSDLRPQSRGGNPAPAMSPDWRLQSVLPVVSIADDHGMSEFDPALDTLFRLSSPNAKNVVSRFYDDPYVDNLVNSFLLQQPGVRGNYAVREFAYFLDSRGVESMCSLLTTWGDGVNITTSDPRWGRKLRRGCPDVDFRVDVVEPPTPVTEPAAQSLG